MMNSKDLTRQLSDQLPKVKPVVENLIEEKVHITESDMCEALALYLYEMALATSSSAERAFERNSVTLDDVKSSIRWVIRKRIEQVSKVKPGVEYKDLEYPMCLYPLVDEFNKVEDYEGGLCVGPQQLDAGQKPEKYDMMITLLRTHRIPVARGLPVAVAAEGDLFYRLSIKDGHILASCNGNDIDPAVVLVRSFYTMPLISQLGEPRYSVGQVAAQKGALSLLVRLGLKE